MNMYGAILGDIVGSPYEFDCNNYKGKDFPLFSQRSEFTDDTVMTLAVAKALLDTRGQDDSSHQSGAGAGDAAAGTRLSRQGLRCAVQSAGCMRTIRSRTAAMATAAPCGFLPRRGWQRSMQEALHLAQLTAEVTHDHPEGIKGAQAVAAAIFLARTGHSKVEIKAYVECKFGYDLSRTCDEIRPTYHHVESCQETVPQAIAAFLESTDFEDALRTAVSLGGDSDTLTAITGSIAEAFYGVPEDLKQECRKRLTPDLEEILQACENMLLQR